MLLKKNNVLLLLYVILSAFYTSPLFNIELFDYVLYALFLFNWFFIILGLFYALKNDDVKVVLSLILIIVVIFMVCMLNGTSLRQCNVILTLIIGMYYTTSISYSKAFYQLISMVGLIYNTIALIYSSNYYMNWEDSGQMTMNPNTIGLVNLFFAIVINSYIHLFFKSRRLKKYSYIIYNGVLLYLLFTYRSRTAQVAFLVFIIIFLLLKQEIVNRPKTLALITGGLAIMGTIVPLLYIAMPKNMMDWIANTTGKPYFSGREIIWGRFYASLADKWNLLIGPGMWRRTEFTSLWNNGRAYSIHNNYLDLILCFGAIGLGIFILFISLRIYSLSKSDKFNNYVCLAGYFSFMVLGYTENNFTYAFFVILFDLLIGMATCYDTKSNKTSYGNI